MTERMAAVVSLKDVIEGLAASQKLLTENMAQQQTTMNQLLKQEGELLQAITPVPMRREPNNGNDNYECYNCHTRITHHEGNDGGRAIILVRKKSGALRMCVDYRALHSKTIKDAHPLPRIDESMDALKGRDCSHLWIYNPHTIKYKCIWPSITRRRFRAL